jgi:5-methylthioadenosine/S-adenosylhomocysteine deaminase
MLREGRVPNPAAAPLLVVGGDVVTMDAERHVVTGATIAIAEGRILAIDSAASLRERFPGASELDANGCVVVPGLINAHQHTTASPLARSMTPEGISSQESIFGWTIPMHAQVSAEDDKVSAVLTAVESLQRGVTTVLEAGTVAHPLQVAAGFREAGIRGRVGRWGWDVPDGPYSAPVEQSLALQEATVRALAGDDRVSGWVTLVGHDLVSDELFTGAAALAEELDVPMTWHMSPAENDVHAYAARSGLRPILHLRRLGVLGPRLLLGHAVWLDDDEVEALLETGTAVASGPAAYLRLGQGYVRAGRHVELVRRGGRVALGCDAHNAGDVADVLRAAWLMAALDRDTGTADPFRADEAFALATIDGARAVGMDATIGSIEVGKAADLVVLDGSRPAWVPRGDLALQRVWGAVRDTVRDVLVAGTVVVRDGRVTTVDVEALPTEARERSAALIERAGISVPHRWRYVAAGFAAAGRGNSSPC